MAELRSSPPGRSPSPSTGPGGGGRRWRLQGFVLAALLVASLGGLAPLGGVSADTSPWPVSPTPTVAPSPSQCFQSMSPGAYGPPAPIPCVSPSPTASPGPTAVCDATGNHSLTCTFATDAAVSVSGYNPATLVTGTGAIPSWSIASDVHVKVTAWRQAVNGGLTGDVALTYTSGTHTVPLGHAKTTWNGLWASGNDLVYEYDVNPWRVGNPGDFTGAPGQVNRYSVTIDSDCNSGCNVSLRVELTLVSDPNASPTPTPAPTLAPPGGTVEGCNHGYQSATTVGGVQATRCDWYAELAEDPRASSYPGSQEGPLGWDWSVPGWVDSNPWRAALRGTGERVASSLVPGTESVLEGVTVCNVSGGAFPNLDLSVSMAVTWYGPGGRISTSTLMVNGPASVAAGACFDLDTATFKAPAGATAVVGWYIFDPEVDGLGVKSARITMVGGLPSGTLDQTTSCFNSDGTVRADCSGIVANPSAGCNTRAPLSGLPKWVICPAGVPVCLAPSAALDPAGWLSYVACVLLNDIPVWIGNAVIYGLNVIIDLLEPYGGGWAWRDFQTSVGTYKPFVWFSSVMAQLDAAAASPAGSDLPAAVTVMGRSQDMGSPMSAIGSSLAPYRSWMIPFMYLAYVLWLGKLVVSVLVEKDQPEQLVFGL